MVRAFALRSCVIFSTLVLCAAGAGALATGLHGPARLVSSDGNDARSSAARRVRRTRPVAVQANMPLLQGTQLRTAEDGRAEIGCSKDGKHRAGHT